MDFGAWVQTWLNVVTKPGEPAFEEERTRPYANLTTALIWVSMIAVITGLVSWVGSRIAVSQFQSMGGLEGILGQMGLPAETLEQLPEGMPFAGPVFGVGGLIMSILFSIVGFLLLAGVIQLSARLFGGTGNFSKFTFLLAAIFVPIALAASLVSLVPFLGGCVAAILWIYELVLAHFAARVEHKLSPGKAVMAVLLPLIVLIGGLICVVVAAGATLFSLMQSGR